MLNRRTKLTMEQKLRKYIQLEAKKILKEYSDEDRLADEEESEDPDMIKNPFYDGSAWNSDTFDEVGLLTWFDSINELEYEIKNNIRGGNISKVFTVDSLIDYINELKGELEDIVEQIEEMNNL